MFLLDTKLPEQEIQKRFLSLAAYLKEGKQQGLHERYICQHRTPWYGQDGCPPAPIVCTYLGRADSKSGRSFRFILNNSRATVANSYLAMYPKPLLARALAGNPALLRKIWLALNKLPVNIILARAAFTEAACINSNHANSAICQQHLSQKYYHKTPSKTTENNCNSALLKGEDDKQPLLEDLGKLIRDCKTCSEWLSLKRKKA